MKIGVLNSLYPPYHRGGAEVVTSILVSDLEKLGHEVFVITTSPEKSYSENNIYYLKSKYYHLNKMPLPLRLFWQINNLFNFQKRNQVKKIINQRKPDLIITNNLMGLGLKLPRLFKKQKIKQIHIIHDIQLLHPSGLMFYQQEKIIDSPLAKKYQQLTKDLMGSPEVIICPSNWLLELHQRRGFFPVSRTKVIPNPIKTNHSVDTSNRDKNSFLAVGLVSKAKGSDILIEAFNKLPELKLTIVGDGDYLMEAKKIAHQNITFLGRLENNQIQELMLKSSALIVPSLCYENSPTVIYEAIGSKLPAIGSNLAGIAELINEYGGLLFKPGDADDLIQKIQYFTDNYERLSQDFPKKPLPPDNYAAEIISLTKNTR
ncbi:MAG: glycosyltransferase [Patescibacteria group bacterium]|jgi:glycosyltransferase involved in cell wall biosynthesis